MGGTRFYSNLHGRVILHISTDKQKASVMKQVAYEEKELVCVSLSLCVCVCVLRLFQSIFSCVLFEFSHKAFTSVTLSLISISNNVKHNDIEILADFRCKIRLGALHCVALVVEVFGISLV